MAEVLKVLLQIHATETAADGWVTTRFKTAKTEKDFWGRLRRLILGEDTLAGGATAGLIGAQIEAGRIAGEVQELSLYDEVKKALEYLSQDGAWRVLIHVNNLESLAGADIAAAARLMQQVRDVFLSPHSHALRGHDRD